MPTGLAHALDDGEQVRQGPGEPVDADHDEGVAGAEAVEQAREFRPSATGAGGFLLEDLRAARGAQLAQLRLEVLGLGRDPGVAEYRHLRLRPSVRPPYADVESRLQTLDSRTSV